MRATRLWWIAPLAIGAVLVAPMASAQSEEPTADVDAAGESGEGDDRAAGDDADDADAGDEANQADDANAAAESGRRPTAVGRDAAAAESLWQLGKALMEMDRLDKACPKLEQSLRLSATPEAALLLAECHQRDGKVASAWADFRQAALMLDDAGRGSEAEQAHARAIALESKVPKLTVAPAVQVPGMDLLRDGVSFGADIFGVAVAIDPGKHHIEVRAPGYKPWSTEVTVGDNGDRQVVAVPALSADKAAAPVARERTRSRRGAMFTSGIITTGAGLATLGVGVILGLVAARDVDMAESDEQLCGSDKVCSEDGYQLIEQAEDKAIGSTVAIAVGSVAVAAGFVLVALDGRIGDGGDRVSARVSPLAGPGVGGMQLMVGF